MNKLKYFFIPIFLFSQNSLFAATGDSLYDQNIATHSIKSEILLEVQEKLYEQYNNTVGATNDIANKGLTLQAIILSVFGVLLTIGGFYLGWLVNSRLSRIQKIKFDVDRIANDINNTPQIFFQRMQDIENEYIFERLNDFDARDIQHFYSLLTTRKLSYKYSDRLIDIYKNKGRALSDSWKFLVLLIQQFPDKVYLDSDLWNDFMGSYFRFYSAFYDKEVDFIVEKIVSVYLKEDRSEEKFKEFTDNINKISDLQKKELWLGFLNKYLENN